MQPFSNFVYQFKITALLVVMHSGIDFSKKDISDAGSELEKIHKNKLHASHLAFVSGL